MFPGVPAPFLLKASLPPLSPASRGEGQLEGKRCTFLCCSRFSFFTPLGVTLDPRHQARCPESSQGARLHCVVGLSTGTWVSPRSFYLFSPISPSFAILKRRWDDALIPAARESLSWRIRRSAFTFRVLLKTVLDYLAYSRCREKTT